MARGTTVYKIRKKGTELYFAPKWGDSKFTAMGKTYKSKPSYKYISHLVPKHEVEIVSFSLVETGREDFK